MKNRRHSKFWRNFLYVTNILRLEYFDDVFNIRLRYCSNIVRTHKIERLCIASFYLSYVMNEKKDIEWSLAWTPKVDIPHVYKHHTLLNVEWHLDNWRGARGKGNSGREGGNRSKSANCQVLFYIIPCSASAYSAQWGHIKDLEKA